MKTTFFDGQVANNHFHSLYLKFDLQLVFGTNIYRKFDLIFDNDNFAFFPFEKA